MRLRAAHVLLPSAFLLLGCASVKVTSIPRAGNTEQISRLYILVASSPAGSRAFLDGLQADLARRFQQRGIPCKTHVEDLLAIDEKAKVRAEIAAFSPYQILEISQSSKTTSNVGDSGATFDLSLFETGKREEPLWKASVQSSGFSSVGSAGGTGEEIIRALVQDRLLSAPAVSQ